MQVSLSLRRRVQVKNNGSLLSSKRFYSSSRTASTRTRTSVLCIRIREGSHHQTCFNSYNSRYNSCSSRTSVPLPLQTIKMTMIPSVSDPSLSSQPPSIPSPMTTSLALPAPVGPPRVVIPTRQTVSGNTRMSNKKPSFSSVSGLADSIPVTPTESISPNTTNNSEKVGRWSDQEHEVFLEGLTKYGKQWKTIATLIGTRTVVQVRTHAQKYFQKMEKSKQTDGVLTGAPSKAVPHHHARPLKTTNSGNKRKASPSPVSPVGRKKQIKTVATIPNNENIIRKVSLGRGTISPPPEAC
jgi:SHAQKYF class myb-like DNA-binding protein